MIFFRVDASIKIGSGHVFRCLTLANSLRERGFSSSFICRNLPNTLGNRIQESGHQVISLAASSQSIEIQGEENQVEHARWLGVSWQQDASDTVRALEGKIVDWLVVDHYSMDYRWQMVLRPYVKKIMVIDDLADRKHDCDILLDQNLVANAEFRYQGLITQKSSALLGPDFALLQDEYAILHERAPPRRLPIRRILIFFGGWDQHNLTALTLKALTRCDLTGVSVDVVINPDSPYAAEIRTIAEELGQTTIFSNLPCLAELMLRADLAIGAGGATTWERLCLGLPSIVVSVAKNQVEICRELAARGLIVWLGLVDSITEDALSQAIQAASQDTGYTEMSRTCLKIADGQGTQRVAEILSLTRDTRLRIRSARLADSELLLNWKNDAGARVSSFQSEVITRDQHEAWFSERLKNPSSCRIYIVETESGMELGQVRFELEADGWEIHYSVASFARGMGLGRKMLEASLRYHRSEFPGVMVFGRVRADNHASANIFDSLGFQRRSAGGGVFGGVVGGGGYFYLL